MNKTLKLLTLAAALTLAILFWLVGCGNREEPAKQVWLYDYNGIDQMMFSDVTIYDKRTGYIKFKTHRT